MWHERRWWVVVVALAGLACEGAPSGGARGASPATVATLERVVLDVADGASIEGVIEPVRAGTDAERVIVITHGPDALIGERVLDARFAGDRLVVLDVDHHLVAIDRGTETTIDEAAWGPLSVAGSRVAYVHGEPPDLELARADVALGTTEILAEGLSPVWSPALSPDGDEVIAVTSASGAPQLVHLARGAIRTLDAPRFPTAPTAPRFTAEGLAFEDELGVAVIELERGAIVRDLPGVHGLGVSLDGTIAGLRDGAPIAIGGAR